MKKRKGEIITLLMVGALVVVTVAAITSSLFLNQKKTINSKAAEAPGTCRDNPVAPPNGYYWKVLGDKQCIDKSQCPKGADNQDGWCYGFEGPNRSTADWRCLQLMYGNDPNVNQATNCPNGQNSPPTNTPVPAKKVGDKCMYSEVKGGVTKCYEGKCTSTDCDMNKNCQYPGYVTEYDCQTRQPKPGNSPPPGNPVPTASSVRPPTQSPTSFSVAPTAAVSGGVTFPTPVNACGGTLIPLDCSAYCTVNRFIEKKYYFASSTNKYYEDTACSKPIDRSEYCCNVTPTPLPPSQPTTCTRPDRQTISCGKLEEVVKTFSCKDAGGWEGTSNYSIVCPEKGSACMYRPANYESGGVLRSTEKDNLYSTENEAIKKAFCKRDANQPLLVSLTINNQNKSFTFTSSSICINGYANCHQINIVGLNTDNPVTVRTSFNVKRGDKINEISGHVYDNIERFYSIQIPVNIDDYHAPQAGGYGLQITIN